jgi:hypothetical protein
VCGVYTHTHTQAAGAVAAQKKQIIKKKNAINIYNFVFYA